MRRFPKQLLMLVVLVTLFALRAIVDLGKMLIFLPRFILFIVFVFFLTLRERKATNTLDYKRSPRMNFYLRLYLSMAKEVFPSFSLFLLGAAVFASSLQGWIDLPTVEAVKEFISSPVFVSIVGGIYLFGFMLLPLGMAFIPGVAEGLVNDPKYHKDAGSRKFHLFTTLQQGQNKMVARGKSVIALLVNDEGVNTPPEFYAGSKDNPKGVKTIYTSKWMKYPLWYILLLFFAPWRHFFLWKVWMYRWTGFIFTGISTVQGIREDEFSHRIRDTEKPNAVISHTEFTDHSRMRPFAWYIKQLDVDLAGKFPVDALWQITMAVVHPLVARLDNLRYDELFDGQFIGESTRLLRKLSPDDVIARKLREEKEDIEILAKIKRNGNGENGGEKDNDGNDEEESENGNSEDVYALSLKEVRRRNLESTLQRLAVYLKDPEEEGLRPEEATRRRKRGGALDAFGILIFEVQLLDVSPAASLSKEDRRRIYEPFLARQERYAAEQGFIAEAQGVDNIGSAVEAHPVVGPRVRETQRDTEVARRLSQGKSSTAIVNLGSGGTPSADSSPVANQTFVELQKLNENIEKLVAGKEDAGGES